jgi:pyridoxamine 5'-phosphate oxidase
VAPERLDSLSAIEAALWRELSAASGDPRHPWRNPVLASTDGEIGDARTVVLRHVDAVNRQLTIFSDARAAKLAQLDAHPIGTLVHWSAPLQWQLRLRVQVEAHTDGLLVSSHWARLKLSPAANDYLSVQAPGSALANALGARGEREHFALLVASVLSVDWLELHPEGHRRARFAAGQAAWLQA